MTTVQRFRYAFKRGRFHGTAAMLRALYWLVVRRWETEICQHCGRPVRQVWWCGDDRLWERVTGNKKPDGKEAAAGIWCIRCFDEGARQDPETGWVEWMPLNLRQLGKN
jgi:hypothetical protein